MAFNTTYNFTSQAIAEGNWNFTDPRGTGLQPAGTAGRWSWNNTDTGSTGVGPQIGQGDAGYVYTEMTSSGVNGDVFEIELDVNHDASTQNITFSYYFGYRGDGNNGTIQLQSNENGAGWVNRGAAEVLDQAGTVASDPFVWLQKTVDLTGLISGTSTRFRLVISQGTNGTVWHKDIGIDTVQVIGVDSVVPGAGFVLVSADKTVATEGVENPSAFVFSDSEENAAITIGLRLDTSGGVGGSTLLPTAAKRVIRTNGNITVRNGSLISGGTYICNQLILDEPINLTNITVVGNVVYNTAGTVTFDNTTITGDLTNADATLNLTVNLLNGSAATTSEPGTTAGLVNRLATVPLSITAIAADQTGAIEGARVFLKAAAGCDLPVNTVIINALTDVNGNVSTADFNFTNSQPVVGWARKSTNSPLFKESPISGDISSTGFSTTVSLVSDE